ncbi:MAG: sugar phosphate isomerase/epimerase [Lentisphaerae bacterium]|nr:sugar phosphate isomerase/epimerase [Lentisphaerota bacterium]
MVPLTFCYPWLKLTRDEQKQKMAEFADNGVKHLVLTAGLLEAGVRDTGVLNTFFNDMQEYGLQFTDSHAFWGNWSDPGLPLPEWKEIMLLRHRIAFQFCKRFGVKTMAFHTVTTNSNVYGKNLTFDDYYKSLISSLEILLPEAERCDVILALENQWTPLNHSTVLLKIIDFFNSPYLGLCYDSGHGNLTEKGSSLPGETIVPILWDDLGIPVQWEEDLPEKFAPYMVNCHLHDNNGILDSHQQVGTGTVDWGRIRKVLKSAPRLQSIQNESAPGDLPVAEYCRIFQNMFNMI